MQLTSEFIAQACGAQWSGPAQIFACVVTDSRKPCQGGLFVALRGDSFDGNDFVTQAVSAGATGVLVSRDVAVAKHVNVFRVDDTLLALQAIARAHRTRFTGRVVGITGSNGKTTTKQMTASVLRAAYGDAAVLATEGSLNNHFGVPLTLLRLTEAHRVAVIEMGMNHFDEIALLTRIARPHVAAITNAAPAHLEGVGSLMGVAKAKGEIFEGLDTNGVAVINADDEYNAYWRVIARDFAQIEFGASARAQVHGNVAGASAFSVGFADGTPSIDVSLPMPGAHNRMNALAVVAIARALGLSMAHVKAGLETASNVVGRLTRVILPNGAKVYDDSYNANPGSMRAAAAVLCGEPAPRYLVLGDMAELGDNTIALHRDLARYIATLPIERVFTCGARFAEVNDAFGGKATNYRTVETLAASLAPVCAPSAALLVKGANSMQMGRVIRLLESTMKETRQ
jgi:UDP-N-acetylmuramoyl-tripeptide--D-alanyl-D-alanine ligase